MQRTFIISSTFALAMGASGLAFAGGTAGGDHFDHHDHHVVSPRTQNAAPSNAPAFSREQTMEMQRALTARNLYQGKADGMWGPKTESAVRNFQTQSGLEVTGTLDEPTARALGIEGMSERQPVSGTDAPPATVGTATPASQAALEDSRTNVQLQSLSQEQAREMQQRLQLLGYYRGTIDGKVGEGTRSALTRYFQRQAELAQQGVISNSAISLFGTEVSDVRR
ncbi:MAG TPA: peptidoglycan-binding protein [Polyangiaceae bacterium]|nr:peptidoglycan-binding protein [Polyangiaceae bacterium]